MSLIGMTSKDMSSSSIKISELGIHDHGSFCIRAYLRVVMNALDHVVDLVMCVVFSEPL